MGGLKQSKSILRPPGGGKSESKAALPPEALGQGPLCLVPCLVAISIPRGGSHRGPSLRAAKPPSAFLGGRCEGASPGSPTSHATVAWGAGTLASSIHQGRAQAPPISPLRRDEASWRPRGVSPAASPAGPGIPV